MDAPAPHKTRAGYNDLGGLQPYPRVTDTEFFDQEASGRKQARILSEQIASRATWIDAKGQQWLNDRLRANNYDRRRLQLTTTQATASKMRRAIDLNGWEMAGLSDNVYDPPAPSQATTTAPIVLVPPGDRKWSFRFQEPETHEVEDELTALRSEMSAQAKSQPEVSPGVPGLDEPGRLVQATATGTDGADTDVPANEPAPDADDSRPVPTIETFDQFLANDGSKTDRETTVVAPDAPQDDMPHDPPEGSLPDDSYNEAPLPTPHTFHPSHRRTGRRVVTVFSGYDGFREAACQAGSIWQAIAGCEDIHQNKKARVIAALWDDNNPHGRIVGDYADLISGLESGALFFGTVDLWAITPPCWDHCTVNKQRAGDNGKAGALIGDAIRLINAIKKRHVIRGLMWEDVPSVADFESFKTLTANLAEPEMGLASTWAFVDVWRFGSPTRRKRVAIVAIATAALRNDDMETPIPGDDRVATSQQPPSAASALLPPHAVPDELRIDAKFYEQLTPGHVQSSLPSIQVGKIIGHRFNSYVYDPIAGPVATIRASVFKAEGPGGNTGLVIDPIGPRRLAPEEATKIHGFDWNKLSHLEPHMIYHIIGNSVTVGMARAFLDYFDRNLD